MPWLHSLCLIRGGDTTPAFLFQQQHPPRGRNPFSSCLLVILQWVTTARVHILRTIAGLCYVVPVLRVEARGSVAEFGCMWDRGLEVSVDVFLLVVAVHTVVATRLFVVTLLIVCDKYIEQV